jgi:hypothetical protein
LLVYRSHHILSQLFVSEIPLPRPTLTWLSRGPQVILDKLLSSGLCLDDSRLAYPRGRIYGFLVGRRSTRDKADPLLVDIRADMMRVICHKCTHKDCQSTKVESTTLSDLQRKSRNQSFRNPTWSPQGLLLFDSRIYIPDHGDIRLRIMKTRHDSALAGHPGVRRLTRSNDQTPYSIRLPTTRRQSRQLHSLYLRHSTTNLCSRALDVNIRRDSMKKIGCYSNAPQGTLAPVSRLRHSRVSGNAAPVSQ